MYASEPHFGGITDKLKMQMRKSIRENRCLLRELLASALLALNCCVPHRCVRLKDVRHKCVSNADVIEVIGQMWWNPRNGFDRDKALFGVTLVPYVGITLFPVSLALLAC
jgi:hypothetical protein